MTWLWNPWCLEIISRTLCIFLSIISSNFVRHHGANPRKLEDPLNSVIIALNVFVLMLNFLTINLSSLQFSWMNSVISLQCRNILKALISEEEKETRNYPFCEGELVFSLALVVFKFPVLQWWLQHPGWQLLLGGKVWLLSHMCVAARCAQGL